MSSKKQALVKDSFIVNNDRGIHTRPATELVKCAVNFKSEIKLKFREHLVNAKSLLGVLMLAAAKGSEIQIIAKGEDAAEAVEAIKQLAANNFNIQY